MNGSLKWAFACAAMAFGQQLAAQPNEALTALLAQDVRLATIAERMLAANRDLCRQHMPLTGLVLHSQDQYRPSVAGDAFKNGRVAVGALVPGSAAAGEIAPGDGIAAIGNARLEGRDADGGPRFATPPSNSWRSCRETLRCRSRWFAMARNGYCRSRSRPAAVRWSKFAR
jgi:hypothetical protein